MSILDSRRGGNGGNGNDDLASLEAGLDALETSAAPSRHRVRRVFAATWPPVLTICLLLFAWELVYRAGVKPTYALPSPADVGLVLREQHREGTLHEALRTSLTRGGIGFLVALAHGGGADRELARARPGARSAARPGTGAQRHEPGLRGHPRHPRRRHRGRAVRLRTDRAAGAAPPRPAHRADLTPTMDR